MTAIGRAQGLAALCLGLALGSTLLSWWVAGSNFRVVDPARNERINDLFASIQGDESRVLAVRYIASESNRAMFQWLGPFQVVCVAVGAALLAQGLRRHTHRARLRTALLAVAVLASVTTAALVPSIVELGREIDFLSRAAGEPAEQVQFGRLHALYVTADVVKIVCLGALVPWGVLVRQQREVGPGREATVA
jgi:hypothetical protein